MSTPPVQPSNPNDPESGSQPTPPAPQFGQNSPQFGQQPPAAPQYGQNAPQYGQNAPQYGQQSPAAPQQGPTPPQYGQQGPTPPQYGQQSPQPYGQAPQQYGQSPYAQYPSEQPQGKGLAASGVPQLVNISFWLIIAAGAMWIISLLFGIPALNDPAMRSTFEQQMAGSGADIHFEAVKGFLVAGVVVVGMIGAGLYALVAFNVRKGKNWARILGTVFAALSIFSVFPPSLGSLVALAGIVAIVLLYLPAAAPYFQKQQPFANPYSQPGNPYGR
jgi:hypothetical protein